MFDAKIRNQVEAEDAVMSEREVSVILEPHLALPQSLNRMPLGGPRSLALWSVCSLWSIGILKSSAL